MDTSANTITIMGIFIAVAGGYCLFLGVTV